MTAKIIGPKSDFGGSSRQCGSKARGDGNSRKTVMSIGGLPEIIRLL